MSLLPRLATTLCFLMWPQRGGCNANTFAASGVLYIATQRTLYAFQQAQSKP